MAFTNDRREALQWFQDWARSDPNDVHQLAISWADTATREPDDSQRVLLECGATFLSALLAGTVQEPKKMRARTFAPGERFELPNGDVVHVQVILTNDAKGESRKYRVMPDGVLALPEVAGHRTYMDEDGICGGEFFFDLTALDADDLQLLPPS